MDSDTPAKPKRKRAKRALDNKVDATGPIDWEAGAPKGPGKPKKDTSFKRHLLPAHLQEFQYRDEALKAYIKELLLEFKTEIEIHAVIKNVSGETLHRTRQFIRAAKTEMEAEFSRQSKESLLGWLEAATFKGLRVCLEQKNMSAYMRGISILKEVYGVEQKIRASFDNVTPSEIWGDAFIGVKSTKSSDPS